MSKKNKKWMRAWDWACRKCGNYIYVNSKGVRRCLVCYPDEEDK